MAANVADSLILSLVELIITIIVFIMFNAFRILKAGVRKELVVGSSTRGIRGKRDIATEPEPGEKRGLTPRPVHSANDRVLSGNLMVVA